RAIRWRTLLTPLTKASLREVWIATCVGFAAVLMIGRAGEIVRPVVLPMRDPRVRPAASIVTIMIERLYDTMTVVVMFGLNLFWHERSPGGCCFGFRSRSAPCWSIERLGCDLAHRMSFSFSAGR